MLALRPGLLLLDEATANLDPDGVALVTARSLAAVAGAARAPTAGDGRAPGRRRSLDLVDPRGRARAGRRRRRRRAARRGVRRAGRRAGRGGRLGAGRRHPASPRRRAPGPGPAAARRARPCGSATRPPGTDALAATDLAVRAGEALALTGPNGAGKSTLALAAGRAAAGRPTARCVAEPALDPPQPAAAALALARPRTWCGRIGTVFQDPEHQFVTATVRDELLARAAAVRLVTGGRGRPRRRAAGPAPPGPAGRGQPVHAVRRREAAAVGGHRAGHRAPRPGPGRADVRAGPPHRASWSTCSPTCATPAAASRSSPTTATSPPPWPTAPCD